MILMTLALLFPVPAPLPPATTAVKIDVWLYSLTQIDTVKSKKFFTDLAVYEDRGPFKEDDVIQSVGGVAVRDQRELRKALEVYRPRDRVDVVVDRKGLETKLTVTLIAR